MSLIGFSGTYYNRCIIFNNPQKKRKLGKENYYFLAKCKDGTFLKMCEMFRIRIPSMKLRTLWYFQH